jgi:LAO/AO transport system kinase
MATRGKLGGLARGTVELSLLLDAAGFDTILIETVGVGQDEVDIAGVADVTVVVLVPGLGDDVQAIKAGIMEIADVLVINKADLPGADRLEEELRAMQSLTNTAHPVPIVRAVATQGSGVDQLLERVDLISKHRRTDTDQIEIWSTRLRELLRQSLLSELKPAELKKHAALVASREEDPYEALAKLTAALPKNEGRVSVEIDHLGIAVRSLAEGLEFYEKALGMTVSLRETVESEGVHVAMLPAGSAPGTPSIELLEASNEASSIAKFVGSRGPGLHHVALRVDNLPAAIDRLKSGGYRVLHEPRVGAGGHQYVFVHPHSTGGVLLELIQK